MDEGTADGGASDGVAELRKRIGFALKGFGAAPPDPSSLVWSRAKNVIKVPVDAHDLPVPALPKFILALMGARNLGAGDKLAWEYAFTYEGSACALSLQKYGLRLYVTERTEGDALRASRHIVSRLKKAQRVLEKILLLPLVDGLVAEGEFVIRNQAPRLRHMYEYFRDRASAEFQPPARSINTDGNAKDLTAQAVADLLSTAVAPLAKQVTGFYDTFAMITAYTSWLEHVLVLLLPFTGGGQRDLDIKKFIGDRWSAKFQKIFDMRDRVAKGHYDTLHSIVEYYRNPYSHGGFDKFGSTIFAFFPHLGPLPLTMSDVRESPTFGFTPADVDGFNSVCAELDRIDEWLESGSTEIGMIWIGEGLDVRFDKGFADELAERSVDIEGVREWVIQSSLYRDDVENMDIV